MFKTILVPTDGSELANKAIDHAIDYARQHDARIIGITVAKPYPLASLAEGAMPVAIDPNIPSIYEQQMRAVAAQYVKKVADAAQAAGVHCETVVISSFSPDEEILNAAKKFNCDAIFMASHGRSGLKRLFIGSTTQKVLTHSTIPVLVLR